MNTARYDVVVIGSGFGGSVTALRLTEKGYRVGVLETGRRWTDEDFAQQGPRDTIWAPAFGMFGPMRFSSLGALSLFTAVGVGGGSLIYANTLYEPHDSFYSDSAWSSITDWRAELAPYYDQAKRMLGIARNPHVWPADEILKSIAEDLGVGDSFEPVNVGVYFDETGEPVPDPYFGGKGPARQGCVHCARCTTGCPFNAKNTLPKNYLHLAENAGADVHELTQVVGVRPLPAGGFEIATRHPGGRRARLGQRGGERTFHADQVVFSAAARGTQELLLQLRENGSLPDISPRLGEFARSNSEAIVIVDSAKDHDFDRGVAITSSFQPDPRTHVELVHASSAQDPLSVLNVPLTDGGPERLKRFYREHLRHPREILRGRRPGGFSKRSVQLLVMQSLDNSLTSYLQRGRLRARQGTGVPNPSWLPIANAVARRFATKISGKPMTLLSDLMGRPATAHYIGGAIIGATPEEGVVDPYHRLHGYVGLHVIDGSTIGANLGVNPSLTITAMAERATALWPNKGEPDPRPPMGNAYQSIEPVAPANPVVPDDAVGALRIGRKQS